jgi:hypothetical protein
MLSIVVHTSFGSSVGSIHGSSIVVETGVGEFGAATVPDALLGVPAVVVAQPVDESEPEARVKPRSEFDSGTRRRIVTRQPDDDLEKGADGLVEVRRLERLFQPVRALRDDAAHECFDVVDDLVRA